MIKALQDTWHQEFSYSKWLSCWWIPAFILILPTLWLVAYVNLELGTVSSAIEDTWSMRLIIPVIQAFSPGTVISHSAEKIIHIALDVLRLMTIGVMGILYVWGFQQFRQAPQHLPGLGRLLLGAGVLGGILMWVVPFHSSDLYGYINRGAQQVFAHTNPYITTIGQIPNWQQQPYFHGHWLDNPCPYGFFFASITRWLVAFSFGEFWRSAALFKLSHLVLHLVNMILVYQCVIYWPGPLNPNQRHHWARFSAWLVGFSPLLLLHHIANGHNDLWVSTGLMACIVCILMARAHLNRRWLTFMAFPLLWCAILTKYSPLVAMPFLVLLWWHTQRHHPHQPQSRFTLWTDAISMVGLCLLVTAFLARPYTQDWSHFPWKVMAGNAGMVQHSIHSMISRLFFYGEKIVPALSGVYPLVRQGISPLIWGVFATGYTLIGFRQAWLIWGTHRPPQPPKRRLSLPEHAVLFWGISLLACMLLVVSSKYHPWYVGMVLPAVLCLAPKSCGGHPWVNRVQGAVLTLSVWQLLAFTPLHNIHVLNYALLSLLPLGWGWHWGKKLPPTGYWPNGPWSSSLT